MRLKLFVAALAALMGVTAARADHCGATSSCDPCCTPKVRYKTCYQNVIEEQTRTCYKTVSRTVMQERKEIVCRNVTETVMKECKETVCKPVWEEKQVTVCTGEWKTEEYCVPGRKHLKLVREEGCCYTDPCTGCTCHKHGTLRLVTCEGPAQVKCKKVWVPRQEIKTVKVCKMVPETVVKQVPVTVCRVVKEEVTKQVPVTVCEKVPYTVTEKVCKRVPVQVAVCECEGPSLLDRCSGLFGGLFHRHGGCGGCGGCDSGCGNGAAISSAPAAAAPAAPAATETLKTMPQAK